MSEVATTGGGAAITHRDWKARMGSAVEIINALTDVLDGWANTLAAKGGGATHIKLIRTVQAGGGDLAQGATRFVGRIDKRYVPVGEAVAAAGGTTEVIHDKTYHQQG